MSRQLRQLNHLRSQSHIIGTSYDFLCDLNSAMVVFAFKDKIQEIVCKSQPTAANAGMKPIHNDSAHHTSKVVEI